MSAYCCGFLFLALLSGAVFYPPASALAQTKPDVGSDLWDVVAGIPYGSELEVQLDDNMQLKGRLLNVSGGMLRLSRKTEVAEMHRNRVSKIYLLSPKPEELRRMMRNLGAITGVAIGLEIGKNKDAGFFLVPALGGVAGAFGGYAVSNRMKTRMLIYDASPRQLPDPQSSKPVKPTSSVAPQSLIRPRRYNRSMSATSFGIARSRFLAYMAAKTGPKTLIPKPSPSITNSISDRSVFTT